MRLKASSAQYRSIERSVSVMIEAYVKLLRTPSMAITSDMPEKQVDGRDRISMPGKVVLWPARDWSTS